MGEATTDTPSFPYRHVAAVALVASAVGLAFILLPMGEMDDFLKSYVLVAIVSVLIWFVLARPLRGRSMWFAATAGLFSPVVACLAAIPIRGIGFFWALFLIKAWYFTIPIALATGLAMHRVVNAASVSTGRT